MTPTLEPRLEPYVAPALPAKASPSREALRALLAERVAQLPALPPERPADRDGPRAVTRSWLARLTHHTRRCYWRGLALWLGYCDWHRLDPLRARPHDVSEWIGWLEPASDSTHNVRLAAVSAWYTELINNRVHDDNPAKLLARRQVPSESRTRALSEDELTRLLGYARHRATSLSTEAALRHLAILEIMATTAVRSGAILHAQCADLGHADGHRSLRYTNKGGARKDAFILGVAELAVQAYLRRRAERECRTVDELSGHLFVTTTGTPLTSRDLSNLVHDYTKAAGIDSPHTVVPHSLRHTVITVGYEHDIDIVALAELAGHGSLQSTMRYIRRSKRKQATRTMAEIVTRNGAEHPAPPAVAEAPAAGTHADPTAPPRVGRPDLRVVRG